MIFYNSNHSKNIYKEVIKEGIKGTKNRVKEILNKCKICARKDKKYERSSKFVETTRPGELVGVDIMEIDQKSNVIVGIDYFTRKVWGMEITTKEAEKVEKFLEKIKEEIKMKQILTDNGKEFDNNLIKRWCDNNQVTHKKAIPYYHESNGRVERANRTIRNALKKTKGMTRIALTKVIARYNNMEHRGIGMTPNEAMKEENWEKVLKNQSIYKLEFKSKKLEKLTTEQKVLIRNEVKATKMEDEFNQIGKVIREVSENIYEIKTDKGKTLVRHASQLRGR